MALHCNYCGKQVFMLKKHFVDTENDIYCDKSCHASFMTFKQYHKGKEFGLLNKCNKCGYISPTGAFACIKCGGLMHYYRKIKFSKKEEDGRQ